ncbi:cytochrome P450 [Paraphaeosphaeria sporulosa]|uniref:Cytochrome P450 n=1 Tax=Paraphaeosphaeria sporulosa TaxID=1460663 RepID=A0A177CM82_9PLEO|nr:cytochrome P450 [Paraphaeosphaeria sporulosa]OAG08623.1 cytochrome P450 [Paraphaeosphaeria sporulosa]
MKMGSATELYSHVYSHTRSSYFASLFVVLLAIFFFAYSIQQRKNNFPTVNSYPRDWALKRAHGAFIADAKGLIQEGFRKFNGPFRIITTLGSRIILPVEYAEWVKKSPALDHQAFVSEEFFARYPGFEGTIAVSDPHAVLIGVVKNKLAQSSQVQKFHTHASAGVAEFWGEEEAWHDARWADTGVRLIGLMSASVFVGDELAQNATWQRITTSYAMTMFMATRALRSCPSWTRPFVHWFLPACRNCRAEVKCARQLLQQELDKRAIEKREAASCQDQASVKPEDSITWVEEATAGRSYDAVGMQLGMSMAAIVTTSELLKQALTNICAHPELVAPLRDEIEASVRAHGWTTAGLFNVQLLDSVIKETQRLNPLAEVNLERKAVRDVTLPSGQIVPRGASISVSTSQLLNPDVYERPELFDGYRYVKLRQKGGKWSTASSAVSTSVDHFVFGMGKFICPGRFFAIAEVKTALAVILLAYDVRLKPGYVPKTIRYGFEVMTDPGVCVEVRRRSL